MMTSLHNRPPAGHSTNHCPLAAALPGADRGPHLRQIARAVVLAASSACSSHRRCLPPGPERSCLHPSDCPGPIVVLYRLHCFHHVPAGDKTKSLQEIPNAENPELGMGMI